MIKILKSVPKIKPNITPSSYALNQLHSSKKLHSAFSTKKFAEDIEGFEEKVLGRENSRNGRPIDSHRPVFPPIDDEDTESSPSSDDESEDDFLSDSSSDEEDFRLHKETPNSQHAKK